MDNLMELIRFPALASQISTKRALPQLAASGGHVSAAQRIPPGASLDVGVGEAQGKD